MSEINYSELDSHIESDAPSNVYLICGDDGYLRRSSLEKLKSAYMPAVMPEFNYNEFDGSTCRVEEIAAAVEMLPVMTERKMVVVKDLDAAAIGAEQYGKLEQLLGALYDTCVLIFFNVSVKSSVKSVDKQGSMRALIKKFGTVINCKTPEPLEIADIIMDSAKRMGAEISRGDAAFMIERCGTDITNLLSELNKLNALCRGKITRTAIKENTDQSVDVKAYMLASNVIQGKRREAFETMKDLFDERTEPVAVLAIMSGAFVDLYRAKLASSCGKNAENMAELFGDEYKGKEKRLSFSFRDCRRYSPELLRRWCVKLYETDAALKSSKTDGRILMEQLLAEMFLIAEAFR